jgi:hypothetical protein
MRLFLAIACFLLAAYAFVYGFVTEYRQSRQVGPFAIVPTLPFAVAAALQLVLGLLLLPCEISWWIFPLTFFGAVVVFGFAIMHAGSHRGSSKAD